MNLEHFFVPLQMNAFGVAAETWKTMLMKAMVVRFPATLHALQFVWPGAMLVGLMVLL